MIGVVGLRCIAEADPMAHTEAVEDRFQHLMAEDPGGCHFVQICQVALKEVQKWKASAQPASHQKPLRRVLSKRCLTPVPRLRLSGFTQPRPAKAGSADGPGDAQASEPQPAAAGSGPQSPSDRLGDALAHGPGGPAPPPDESAQIGVQAQRSDAQASELQPAAAGSGPQSSADGLGEATLAPGVGGLASRPNEFAQPGGPAQRSQIPGRRPKRVQQSRAGGKQIVQRARARGPAKASKKGPKRTVHLAGAGGAAPAPTARGGKRKAPSEIPRPARKIQCQCSGNCSPKNTTCCPAHYSNRSCPNPAHRVEGGLKTFCGVCRCSAPGCPRPCRRGTTCFRHAKEGKTVRGQGGWKPLSS